MAADIVNLRQKRKAKARTDKEAVAEQNRLLFGRTKAQKQKETAERTLEATRLDGLKLQTKPSADE